MEYKGNVEPKTASKLLLVLGIIVTLISVPLFLYSVKMGFDRGRCTESTIATVTDVQKHQIVEAKKNKPNPHAKYEYITQYTYKVNGRTYRGFATLTEREYLEEGAILTVWYAPDDPDVGFSEYDDAFTSTAYYVTLMFFMTLLAGGGIALIVVGLKMKKKYGWAADPKKGKSSGTPKGNAKGARRKGKQRSGGVGKPKGGKPRVKL